MRNINNYDIYNNLELNCSVYFFKKNKNVIYKKSIEELFKHIIDVKKGKVLERQVKIEDKVFSTKNSLLVFSFNTIPNFLKKIVEPSNEKNFCENNIGFLLLVEIDKFVVIIKKKVSITLCNKFIKDLLMPINPYLLFDILTSNSFTKFQRVSMTNMNMNPNAIRNKSFEAEDLENSMPMLNAKNSILSSIRFDNDDKGIFTLNFSTSLLSQLGVKFDIKGMLSWIKIIVDFLNKDDIPSSKSDFLSEFALVDSWENQQSNLNPVSFLINWQQIITYIESDAKLYINENNVRKEMSEEDFNDFLTIFNIHLLEEVKDNSDNKNNSKKVKNKNKENNKKYKSDKNPEIIIVKNQKRIWIENNNYLNKYEYQNDMGEYEKIINLINKLKCYSISFNDYKYIYYGGCLYKSNDIINVIKNIEPILFSWPKLSKSLSEKGSKYTSKSKKFKKNCVFGIVESYFKKNSDILVCDDMGNEWADHIAISKSEEKISFIHSKSNNKKGETSLSASAFQDVIGQALKNIGNFNPTDKALYNKRSSLARKYVINNQQTKIRKIRTKHCDPNKFVEIFKELRVSPNLKKEICIAVDFLSKDQLITEFKQINKNEEKYYFIQLLWLLSGFISICKDADINCRIFCCE